MHICVLYYSVQCRYCIQITVALSPIYPIVIHIWCHYIIHKYNIMPCGSFDNDCNMAVWQIL